MLKKAILFTEAVLLQILEDGFGFLRYADTESSFSAAVQRIFMCHPVKFDVLVYVMVMKFTGLFVRLKKVKDILHC